MYINASKIELDSCVSDFAFNKKWNEFKNSLLLVIPNNQ